MSTIDPVRTNACLAAPTPASVTEWEQDFVGAGYSNMRAEMERLAATDKIDDLVEAIFFPGKCSESIPSFACKDGQFAAGPETRQYFFYMVGTAFAHNGDPKGVLLKLQSAMNANNKLSPIERRELSSAFPYKERPTAVTIAVMRAPFPKKETQALAALAAGGAGNTHQKHASDAAPDARADAATSTDISSKVPPLPKHRVEQGQTYWSIAGKRLHDTARHPDIAAVNPGRNPDKLPIGKEINLPRDADTPPVNTPTKHVVRAGQSPWSICVERYGDGTLWHQLVAANKGLFVAGTDKKGQQTFVAQPDDVLRLPANLHDRLIKWEGSPV